MEISRYRLADLLGNYVKKLKKKMYRAARAARLYFLIQPIKSLICCVFVVTVIS